MEDLPSLNTGKDYVLRMHYLFELMPLCSYLSTLVFSCASFTIYSLDTGRSSHGCGTYLDSDNNRVSSKQAEKLKIREIEG